MKVLLVYANTNRYLAPPPVGLSYLIPPLIRKGHEVRLLDLMLSTHPGADVEATLREFSPDVAGFSVRNLDNQVMMDLKSPLPEIRGYVGMAKAWGVATVLGGTAFTTFPVEMLDYMGADYGIAGQGEKAFPLLIEAMESERFDAVPGLVYRQGRHVVRNPPDVGGYAGASADWSLIDLRRYQKISPLCPTAAVVIKTGCPYECTFCDAKISMGNRLLFRDADAIVEDIEKLKCDRQIRNFFFVDPCFNSPLVFCKKELQYKATFAILCACATRYVLSSTRRNET